MLNFNVTTNVFLLYIRLQQAINLRLDSYNSVLAGYQHVSTDHYIITGDNNLSNITKRQIPDREDLYSLQYLEILRIILACSGILLNALNLILIHKIRHALRPHMRLILCLIISDLLLSIEVILFFAIKNVSSEFVHCLKFVMKSFETINVLVLMLNLLLIAIDQCVATLYPLRYHQIVTRKRTHIALCLMWIISIFIVASGTVLSTLKRDDINEVRAYDCFNIKRQFTFFINSILGVMAFPVFMGIYIAIYRSIRQLRGRDSIRGRTLSTRKATLTTLILIGPVIMVYTPVSAYILIISVLDMPIDWPFWETFMVLLALHTNSDPIICAIRFRDLREGYKRMCRK